MDPWVVSRLSAEASCHHLQPFSLVVGSRCQEPRRAESFSLLSLRDRLPQTRRVLQQWLLRVPSRIFVAPVVRLTLLLRLSPELRRARQANRKSVLRNGFQPRAQLVPSTGLPSDWFFG